MAELQFDPEPETFDELIVKWAARDAEYAKRRLPLDPEAVHAIREGRQREASLLPVFNDRAKAWQRATTWMPPSHPEYGDMKEWLS